MAMAAAQIELNRLTGSLKKGHLPLILSISEFTMLPMVVFIVRFPFVQPELVSFKVTLVCPHSYPADPPSIQIDYLPFVRIPNMRVSASQWSPFRVF